MPAQYPGNQINKAAREASGGGFVSDIVEEVSQWLQHSQESRAPSPIIRFSDLISGPASGLGDGQGSGAIVTIWCQGVGDSQGSGEVYFTDSEGTKRAAAHVYYWKRADGDLPSGPARLWYSHLMQEIAFSIPAGSANGEGSITVETGGQTSNSLPFTVRSGNIYHIREGGSDSNDGSYDSPWATWDGGARASAPAGSTVYFHDIESGSLDEPTRRGIYWNNGPASSGLANQFSIVAYPGFHPIAVGQEGIENYQTEGMVVSKFKVFSSDYLEKDQYGQPVGSRIHSLDQSFCIRTSANGRVIGNRLTEIPGGISSAQQGAISGNKSRVNGVKLYGNEVHDYGDNGTKKFHHTTYLSIRQDNLVVDPWEFGWNFLHSNKAKFGIHNYDETNPGADMNAPLRIHDNVVIDQGGAGISVGSSNGWSMDGYIENNLLINCGLAAAWDGQDISTVDGAENGSIAIRDYGLTGTFYVNDNLSYKWNSDEQVDGAQGAMSFSGGADNVTVLYNNNVSITPIDRPFIGFVNVASDQQDNISGSENAFYTDVSSPTDAVAPSWDASAVTSDPQVTFDGAIAVVASGSPIIGPGATSGHDLYGVPRSGSGTIGPVESV